MPKLSIPINAGSDPQIIDLEDCHEVYGDQPNVVPMFPEIYVFCENPDAPSGQCHYNAVSLDPTLCLYCHKKTG